MGQRLLVLRAHPTAAIAPPRRAVAFATHSSSLTQQTRLQSPARPAIQALIGWPEEPARLAPRDA